MPISSAVEHLTAVLHSLAGPQAVPRADQLAAVDAVINPSARVLVVQATGWGKGPMRGGKSAERRSSQQFDDFSGKCKIFDEPGH